MTAHIPENTITMPPRDPNDDDDDAEAKDGDAEPSEEPEPAVIREPDE